MKAKQSKSDKTLTGNGDRKIFSGWPEIIKKMHSHLEATMNPIQKQFTLFYALLFVAAFLNAQSIPTMPIMPAVPSVAQISDTAYHRFFEKQGANQATLQDWAPVLRQHNSAIRSVALVYQQLAYRLDTWNDSSVWANTDSAIYNYNNFGWAMDFTRLNYADTNWQDFVKISYTYDVLGNQLTYLNQIWNKATSSWQNVSLFTNTYYAPHHNLSYVFQIWDATNSQWRNMQQVTSSYNDAGNTVQQASLAWSVGENAWVNTAQYLYSYDSSGREASYVYQNWNDGAGWITISQMLFSHDASGNLLTITSQNWQTSGWMNNTRLLYTYDAKNNLTELINQTAQDSVSWLNVSRVDDMFDSSSNRTSETVYLWDAAGAWDSSSRFNYTFNRANSELSENDAVFSDGIFHFTNSNKFTYNESNYNTGVQTLTWNPMNSTWQPALLYTYTYNEQNNVSYELDQSYNNGSLLAVNVNQYLFYYQAFAATGISDFRNDLSASIYPNPSSGQDVHLLASFDRNTDLILNIYDNNGRIVSTETRGAVAGENNFNLGVPMVAAGYYFVQLTDRSNGKNSVLKLIRQ